MNKEIKEKQKLLLDEIEKEIKKAKKHKQSSKIEYYINQLEFLKTDL